MKNASFPEFVHRNVLKWLHETIRNNEAETKH